MFLMSNDVVRTFFLEGDVALIGVKDDVITWDVCVEEDLTFSHLSS